MHRAAASARVASSRGIRRRADARAGRAGRSRRATRNRRAPARARACRTKTLSPGIGRSLGRRRGNEHEDAGVRSALVQLSGRVQIPRSVAEHRRRPRAIAHRACEASCSVAGQRGVRARGTRAARSSRPVFDAASGSARRRCRAPSRGPGRARRQRQRRRRRQRRGRRRRPAAAPSSLVAVEQHAASRPSPAATFGSSNGLMLEQRAGDRGRDLPAHELGAERGRLGQRRSSATGA